MGGSSGVNQTVSHRLAFNSTPTGQPTSILSGLLPWPLSYAETPDGYVQMANGFMAPVKWDGLAYAAVTVGVAAPTTAPVIGSSGTGELTGTYRAYVRWIDKDGNPSNLSPVSNEITITDKARIDYTSVPLTGDPKVRKVQILRNTSGQAKVYYVDVESTDLTGTTFSSTFDDTDLAVQEAVPLFDTNNNSIANRFGVPPNHKPYLLSFQGRVFAAGAIDYDEGHAEVTFNSTTVQGVGTTWVSAMIGRFFYVVGSPTVYEISAVDETNQTLTLTAAYSEATDLFAVYTIRVPPAERRTVYFCESGQYDAWPAANAVEIEDNGDENTGLANAESFIFILQRRHIYRMSYQNNPIVDGGVFLACDRGCVNNRSWVKLNSSLYFMDEEGVYEFEAGGSVKPISDDIQDMFWADDKDSEVKINWKARKFFHAALFRAESTIRWFVALDGNDKPQHALCYSYLTESWWIERAPWPLGASTLWPITTPRVLVAGPAKRVFGYGMQELDALKAGGTVRDTASSATVLSLTDSSASFQATGIVGMPLSIYDGTGRGQTRLITSRVSGTVLTIDRPWQIIPDETSKYQLGGIPWFWRAAWLRWLDEDQSNVRRLVILFEPLEGPNQINARLFLDQLLVPQTWGDDWAPTSEAADALTVRKNDVDLAINLTQVKGIATIRMDQGRDRYLHQRDLFALEMEGVSGEDPLRLYQIIAEGATS